MAEFQEVMRQLNKLCSHYQYCSDCPMFDECGNLGAHCSDPKHSYRIEKTVMAWAAEQPEPVYPTWEEWLDENGVIGHEPGARYDEDYKTVPFFKMKIHAPIPADIAQKLGLEPKAGGKV